MQARLKELYEYNPEIDNFIYKFNSSKGEKWNNDFNGKEVKPLLCAGKRYLFVDNVIYNMSQLIGVYLGIFDFTPKGYTQGELINLQNQLNKSIQALSDVQLRGLQEVALKGDLQDSITYLYNVKGKNKSKGKSKEQDKNKDKGTGKWVKKTLEEKFNKDNIEVNSKTGLPKHIYYRNDRGYYVHVQYQKVDYKKFYQKDLEEALEVRNALYDELLTKFN